jgi:chorismate mutase
MTKFELLLIFIFTFFLSTSGFAAKPQDQKITSTAEKCKTLKCVRKNIDNLDAQIVTLIGKRLNYVKRAGELKKNQSLVYDPGRENRILNKVGQQTKNEGYAPSIAKAIFKTILSHSTAFEKRFVAESKN